MKRAGTLLVALFFGVCSASYCVATVYYSDGSAANIQLIHDNLAQDGDIITIPAGTFYWATAVNITKAVTIQGAGAPSTVIINTQPQINFSSLPLFYLIPPNTATGVQRVTGIAMKSPLIVDGFTLKSGIGVEMIGYPATKRVDHCTFDDLYAGIISRSSVGLTDHNTIRNCGFAFRQMGQGWQQQYAWDNFRNYPNNAPFNTLDYTFHEDEYIEMTGDSEIIDEVESCDYVIRYCTIVMREAHGPYVAATSFPVFDAHGDIPTTLQYSTISNLIYENQITLNAGTTMSLFQLRGGQSLTFNNQVVTNGGSGSASVALREERDEYPNWPSWLDPQYEDRLHNTYVWNNTYNGVVQAPYVTAASASHMHVGTDPISDPTACAWTTAPTNLASLLPPYPHPLTLGDPPPSPTPTPTPTPTATPSPAATPTPCLATVPDFVGVKIMDAQTIWQSAGFTTEVITNGPPGQRISWQSLPPGYQGDCSTTVIVVTDSL